MVAWEEFERQSPTLAADGRRMLLLGKSEGAGLAYLATVRRNGAPRVHPISPALLNGHLYAFILKASPKAGDIVENPRYALHSFPHSSLYLEERFNDEEFFVLGRAVAVNHHETVEKVAETVGDTVESGTVFELGIERALAKHREKGKGVVYTKWKCV